jgi:hypothetical protein
VPACSSEAVVDEHGRTVLDASGAPQQRVDYAVHDAFPMLPAAVPLVYTLTMQACVAQAPAERPTFEQAAQLLEDTAVEVAGGMYVDSEGRKQVRARAHLFVLPLPRFRVGLLVALVSLCFFHWCWCRGCG